MSFATLILVKLVRQRRRTALTAPGIAIGITTVIAFGVIVDGLMASAGRVLTTAGSDLMVGQRGAAALAFSTVSEDVAAAVAGIAGVERAVGALITISRVGGNPFFVAIGVDPGVVRTLDGRVGDEGRATSTPVLSVAGPARVEQISRRSCRGRAGLARRAVSSGRSCHVAARQWRRR